MSDEEFGTYVDGVRVDDLYAKVSFTSLEGMVTRTFSYMQISMLLAELSDTQRDMLESAR